MFYTNSGCDCCDKYEVRLIMIAINTTIITITIITITIILLVQVPPFPPPPFSWRNRAQGTFGRYLDVSPRDELFFNNCWWFFCKHNVLDMKKKFGEIFQGRTPLPIYEFNHWHTDNNFVSISRQIFCSKWDVRKGGDNSCDYLFRFGLLMLFLGRSPCEDFRCNYNYNQKERLCLSNVLLDRPVPRWFFVHSFAPSLVLFTVHMPLILPLSVFSRKTLSPLFDKSHPVCLFSCFFSVSRESRRSEITKRADIWSLCVFSRWNVEGIYFNWRYGLAAAKM